MRTLVIHQEPANIVHVTDGDENHGDVMTYEAVITGPDGLTGVIVGFLTSARQHGETHWDRQGMATFSFGDEDKICVAGLRRYGAGEVHSPVGVRNVGPVIGGSGQFIGARGELATMRDADGRFTHTFTLLD